MIHVHTYRYDTVVAVLRGGPCGCTTGRYTLLLTLQYKKSTALALLLHDDEPGTSYYYHEWARI